MRPARALVAVALVLSGIAWVWGNPPGGAPDELSHYIRALGVGGGEIAGRPIGRRPVTDRDLAGLDALLRVAPPNSPAALGLAWMRRQTREFTIPPQLGVNGLCLAPGSTRLRCVERLRASPPLPYAETPMGTYQPLPYVLPGLAARTAGDPVTAIRIARLAVAALCLGLIALAAAVIAHGGPGGSIALLGLVAATSPAVLLTAVTITSSGTEIAGAIAFGAGLLAVTRPGGRWWGAWTAVGVGGVMLASSRSLGPLFVVFAAIAVAGLRGKGGVQRALASPRTPASAIAALVALAAALAWVWEFTRQPHPGVAAADIGPGLSDAVEDLPGLGRQVVGVFGAALDIPMPTPVYLAWAVLLLGVVGLAARVADRRERAVLAGLAVAAPALALVLAVAVRPTGFGVQTRHLLPVFVLLPLGAGEILRHHARELAPRTVRAGVLAAVGIAAAVHIAAWYVNARGWSGAPGRPGFLISGSRWSPPGTWVPWGLAMLVGAGAYVGAALTAAQTALPDPRPRHRPSATPDRVAG